MAGLAFLVLALGIGFALGAAIATAVARIELLQSTPDWVVGIAVVVGGLSGALASGRPTGTGAIDVTMRVAFAALIAFLASRARRRSGALAAAILVAPIAVEAVAERGSALVAAVAAATAGLALARWAFPDRVPILGSVVGTGMAWVVLRQPSSLAFGTPSVVAAIVAVVLAISAWAVLGRRTRRIARIGATACGVATFAGVVAAAVVVANARTHAELGIDRARDGLAAARAGNIDEAETTFAASRDSLRRSNLWLRSPGGRLARVLPIVSQHLAALGDLTLIAADLAETAGETAAQADLEALRTSGTTIDLARLATLRDDVRTADEVLTRTRVELAGADNPWLVRPLQRRIRGLRTEVDDAAEATKDARRILDVVPDMLGADGPRRYLIVLVTPSEARGSGGLIGNFAELTATDGTISLSRFGRTAQLITEGVPTGERVLNAPADYTSRYVPFGAPWLWSNLTMGPDFPTTAAVLADQYPQSGGSPVDGVISADPVALAGFLRLLGPIQVAGWPEAMTSDNVAEVLLHKAYLDVGGDSPERVALLAEVTQKAWERFGQIPAPSPGAVAEALGPAIDRRHLQLWMRDADEQALMVDSSLAGAVPAIAGDGLGIVVNNASESKIEWYLHRTIDADIVVDPVTGGVQSVVSVTLRNDAPSGGTASYPLGYGRHVPVGSNRLHVSVYSPLPLTGGSLDGKAISVRTELEVGRNVYSIWVVIPPGETRTLSLALAGNPTLTGSGAGGAGGAGSGADSGAGSGAGAGDAYRLDYFTQALVRPDDVTIRVRSVAGSPLVGVDGWSGTAPTLAVSLQPNATERFVARIR